MNDRLRPTIADIPCRRAARRTGGRNLWLVAAIGLCWLSNMSLRAQSVPSAELRLVPPTASEPTISEPATTSEPATDSFHAQLPTTDWRAVDAAALPPPPGWVAAEFASLSPTQGSSPESEPLFPGDELTMETGRLASHRSGFFQKLSLSGAWFNRNGADDMGMVEARSFLTVALPLPSRDFPLLVTTGFDATPLNGPVAPNLPPAVYDAYMDFMWLPKLADRWLGILAISPGVYSDFDDVQTDAWRFKGKALVKYDWIPNRVQVAAGILYLDRFTVNWLPAGGVIWDPTDDVHLEMLFPRPKFAYRYTATALHEDWAYLAGEFGGDTWSVRRSADEWDLLELVDWRIYLGIERKRDLGVAARLEVGYVFSRTVKFASSEPDYHPENTIMIRSGFEY